MATATARARAGRRRAKAWTTPEPAPPARAEPRPAARCRAAGRRPILLPVQGDGSLMKRRERAGAARWGAAATALLLAALLATAGGCRRNEGGQLPEPGGEPIAAEREAIEGFALVRAWPDQEDGGLALAVEFSRTLVGTQDYDRLLTFAEPVAGDSSWSLDGDGRVLRFPFVEPDREYPLRVSAA